MPEQHAPSTPPRVRLPGLDPEATPVIGLGLGVTGILFGLRPRLAPLSLAATALAALLFRDPERDTPSWPGALVAPGDGTVTAVEEVYEHRFLHTDAIRVTISSSPLDVPVQRSPVAGSVAYVEHVPGAYRPLWERRSADADPGDRLYIGIATDVGPVLMVVVAGQLARRVSPRVSPGQRVAAGQRVCTARFGATVDLFIPRDVVEGLPAPGEQLVAGVSPVGRSVPL